MLEPKSFDIYKNTIIPMIAILNHSKVDTEISDTSMEPMGSNNCRELSGDNRNIISMLAVI